MNKIHDLSSLAVNQDLPLHQLDIKNVFHSSDLEEEVYMEIPLGLETETNINKFYKLKKIIYGIKQSPQAWFDRFTKPIRGFVTPGVGLTTLFVKHTLEGRTIIIIIYIDDITLTKDHEHEIGKLKSFLAHEFEIKDLGNLKYFPKMEIVG